MKHLLALPLLLFLMAIGMVSQGQTVTLDQADLDYAPGETVYITGTEFQPGEQVTMTISHIEPGLPLVFHEHALFYATADSTGTFNASWYVQDVELNTTLSLLAEGDQGSLASIVFTDAIKTDTYPSSQITLTGKTSYCLNEVASNLTVEWVNTTCNGTSNGSNTNVEITIKWYITTSGTAVQTTNADAKTTSSTYIPPTNTAGTLTYYVVVSWNDGPNCVKAGSIISNRRSVTINTFPETPKITAGGPTTFCTGGSVALTSSAGSSYLWSTGATTQSINVSSTGNYTVQVTNANGCQSAPSAPTTVTVNPLPTTPTITASGPTTFCTGGSVALTSSLGSSYLWSTGETTRSITVTAPGNYTIRVTNAAGCQSNVSAITAVTVNPIPSKPTITANGGITTVCDGGSVLLSSSSSSGNQWYRNGSAISGAVNQTFSATSSGSYTVVVSADGCPSPVSDAINVTVNPRPTGLLSGTQTICNGNSATLSIAVTGTGPWNGTLTGGIPFSGNSSPITVNVSPATNTTYSLTSLTDAQCTAVAGDLSGNAIITVRPIPSATIAVTGNSTICSGSTTTIKITGPINGTVIYNINGGSDITGTFNNGGNLNLTTASLLANTTYNLVSVAYGDAPGCSNSVNGSVTITVNQPPAISTQPENKTVTYGSSTSFTVASTGSPAPTYQWQVNTGSGYTNIAGETASTLDVHNPTVAMNGYKYRVIVNNICSTVISNEVNLTVNARPVTITADAKNKTYGNTDPSLTYQITSGSLAFSDVFTGSLTRVAGEDVGNYAINQGTVALNSNYALTYVVANLTIDKREVTITADAKSKVYGDADPALTYQITSGSLAFSDVFSGSLTRDAGEDIGSYAIKQGTVALNSNYDLSFVGANLTIDKRAVTITAIAKNKIYGNDDPALTFEITLGSLAFKDVFAGALTRDAGEAVGAYAITQGTVALNSNYDLSFVGNNLTIGKRSVEITADAKTKVYGDAEPALTYKITTGSLAFSDAFSGILTRDAGEDVGSYAIKQGTVALNGNYTLTYIGANLSITSRPVTITADAQSKVYGDADPALSYKITNGTLAFSDAFSGSLTRDAGEDVGNYAITQGSVALNGNYTLTYVGNNLTIGKRSVEITADAKTKVYGDDDPALTFGITYGKLVFKDDFTGALVRDAGETVGAYAINQGTLALNSNYDLSFVGANLTIDKRVVTITAIAKNKIYGNDDPALTFEITLGSLAFKDVFAGALTRDAGEDVGSFAIKKGTVALNGNYTLTYVGNNLTIGKRSVEITADAQSKVYGDADPALSYKITNGTLAFSDAFLGSLTRDAGEDVGSYAIKQGTVALNSNYDLSFVGANLRIDKRAVTITAIAKNKIYGNDDPALTFEITNGTLAFKDVFAGALTRDTGEDIGNYAIKQGTVALNTNYDLSFVGANLTIDKRSITITADAQSKVYGDADPTLSYKITNGMLAFKDAFAGVLTRDTGEDVGNYAIKQGTVALNTNYDLSFVGNNLRIDKRPITITADAKTKTYGDNDPILTAQATNTVNKDAPSGALTRAEGENVGSYAISKDTYTYGGNYAETFIGANLAIDQRPIIIKAEAKNKTYGDPDPELTAQASNVVNNDQPTGALSRAEGKVVGSYLISKSTYTYGGNYAETFIAANLVIDQRPITITADAKSKIYGDLDPALTAVATNVVIGDAPSGALSRAEGENVGSYAISKDTYTYGGNYAESFIGANLMINQLPVTVTAVSASKYFGQNDPALSFVSVPAVGTRLANGEVISFTGSLKRVDGECVSEQDILIGSLDNANYKIDYKPSKFTIKGVSIDASQCSVAIQLGQQTTITLKALTTDDLSTGIENVPVVIEIAPNLLGINSLETVNTDKYGIANRTISLTNLPVGLYKIVATVVSKCNESVTSTAYMTIYDPNGSFITGGGWINSPAGALTIREGSESLSGKANFGFNAKYKKGKTPTAEVEGNTEFQFQIGNFNFKSNMLSSGTLVISGAKATFRGEGTVNDTGNYGFMVSAVDGLINGSGNIDKFRIKIWDKNTSKTVYDNFNNNDENATLGNTTILGGGSIVIHEIKPKSAEILPDASIGTFEPTFKAYPNPFTEKLNIEFSYTSDTKAKLEIYSITGAKLQTLYDGPVTGGQLYSFEYVPRLVSSQMVFYHLTLDGKTQVGKILYNEKR